RALAFEKQNRRVGSSSSPVMTGASGSGNVASCFAHSQAKAGGGNTGPVSRVSGSSGLFTKTGRIYLGKEVAEDSEIPKATIPLLEEFLDVFPDELPDGFSPLRDIQHHIDLEPGS
ncbi:hypothetical protein Tco_0509396, partial [Tanacetum coccineum]